METILKEANEIILRQKKELDKARNNNELKEKIKQLENDHLNERKQSQRDFDVFKQQMAEKEAHLEREYKEKAQDMKDNLVQIKKKFEDRCEEFRKQMVEYRTNNEAIEALKKAHAKELAAHVQEHNKKYSDLLQAKLDSEDQLKEQAERDKAKLAQDWQQKLNRAVEENQRTITIDFNRKMKE